MEGDPATGRNCDSRSSDGRLPVAVVTGFLGSGKTTLINALLRHPDMGETAVLVNELGEIGLDHLLIEAIDETTVLLGAGCLCCALREDMVTALASLLARRAAGEVPDFCRVVVETTGLADPAPILHTLLAHDTLRERYRVDAIVTTVDALHGAGQLERHNESLRQAAVADRLVLTKTDLADPAAVACLRDRLAAINHGALLVEAVAGDVAPDLLFDAGLDAAASRPERLQAWLGAAEEGHRHDHAIATFTLTAETPLRVERVVAWIEDTIARHGDRLLRLKGLLDLVGSDVPVAVHGVQHVFHPLVRLNAWPAGPRRSTLVLIGKALPEQEIRQSFAERVEGAG
jgi:G3E family GTPase